MVWIPFDSSPLLPLGPEAMDMNFTMVEIKTQMLKIDFWRFLPVIPRNALSIVIIRNKPVAKQNFSRNLPII